MTKHWQSVQSIALLALVLVVPSLACSLGSSSATPDAVGGAVLPTLVQGTVISATSSIPTATPVPPTTGGRILASGTLIVTQLSNTLAQTTASGGQTVTLSNEQFGAQASPDGHYGVRFTRSGTLTDLTLVDFSITDTTASKDIPQGKGLSAPNVTWKDDSSGFAFYEVPFDTTRNASGIRYFDVTSGQTKQLTPAATQPGTIAASIAFSPDGKSLVYALSNTAGTGASGNQLFMLDTSANRNTPLPAGANAFNQWLRNGQGFIATQIDAQSASKIVVYMLSDLANPRVITPANITDSLVDISPDGKFIVVTSAPSVPAGQPAAIANIAIMNLDGSSRKVLTNFSNPDQSITALVWGNNGIYYSITSADNTNTTWRMDLDGSNQAQVAQGTLNSIVGVN
jgi:WD40-like Beta Propeller Repeat